MKEFLVFSFFSNIILTIYILERYDLGPIENTVSLKADGTILYTGGLQALNCILAEFNYDNNPWGGGCHFPLRFN